MARNDQENFWSQTYAKDYIKKNLNVQLVFQITQQIYFLQKLLLQEEQM